MANYCPNCGASINGAASYCSNCGAALNNNGYNGCNNNNYNNNYNNNGCNNNYNNGGYNCNCDNSSSTMNTMGTILGTLMTVSLIGGLTRQLYYYNGRYFLDPYCRRPFVGPRVIGHRPMGMPPRHVGRPMGLGGLFRRGPGGFGGHRGGPGGFGGGPRGGRP